MAKNTTIVTASKAKDKASETTEEVVQETPAAETVAEQQDSSEAVQETASATETPAAEEKAESVAEEVAEPAPVSTEQEAAAQDSAEQATEEKPELDAWTQKIETLKAKGTAMERMVVQTLEEYVTKMRPGNIMSVSEINQQQLQLWRIIKLVIESADGFSTCYPLIIAYARQYKDACFHDRLLYRGMEHITLDKDTATYYLGSLNVIKLAATSKSKKEALAQVDLNRVMNEHIFSDDGRNRVIQYFNR